MAVRHGLILLSHAIKSSDVRVVTDRRVYRRNPEIFPTGPLSIDIPHEIPVKWGALTNPYLFSLWSLVVKFNTYRNERLSRIIPPGTPIDFLFDERSERSAVEAFWGPAMQRVGPEHRKLYGNQPRFVKDEDFLPLQAADLFAGAIRKSFDDEKNGLSEVLPSVAGKMPGLSLSMTQTDIANTFAGLVSQWPACPPAFHVVDKLTGRPFQDSLGQMTFVNHGKEL